MTTQIWESALPTVSYENMNGRALLEESYRAEGALRAGLISYFIWDILATCAGLFFLDVHWIYFLFLHIFLNIKNVVFYYARFNWCMKWILSEHYCFYMSFLVDRILRNIHLTKMVGIKSKPLIQKLNKTFDMRHLFWILIGLSNVLLVLFIQFDQLHEVRDKWVWSLVVFLSVSWVAKLSLTFFI